MARAYGESVARLAVLGGSVVGSAAALLFARSGWTVTVVDPELDRLGGPESALAPRPGAPHTIQALLDDHRVVASDEVAEHVRRVLAAAPPPEPEPEPTDGLHDRATVEALLTALT